MRGSSREQDWAESAVLRQHESVGESERERERERHQGRGSHLVAWAVACRARWSSL